ncbi:MAG: quinoprotein dehydrogenase-associated putative ABC transporter substrate-binding protein [Ramlibacter sp.]
MRRVLAIVLLALGAVVPAVAATAPVDVLRICADPDNLPYSRSDGSGFEDQIARVLAQELGVALQYAWLPDRRAFVRKTLGAGLCDVLVGVPVGFERAELTAPYYRSSYVWLQRADAGAAPAGFDDPRLASMRIGVQLIGNDMATSPPALALARHAPAAQVVGFPLAGETPSAQRIVAALAAGELDGALVWGPQAGFFAQRASVPLRLVRLAPPADQPRDQTFDFAIAVGVRKGEDALRDRLQAALRRRQADIDRILAQYGVPLVGATP